MNKRNPLNKRQLMILDYIQDFCKTYGYPPSVRDIGKAVGLKSSSTVHAYMVQLEEKGYIPQRPI